MKAAAEVSSLPTKTPMFSPMVGGSTRGSSYRAGKKQKKPLKNSNEFEFAASGNESEYLL